MSGRPPTLTVPMELSGQVRHELRALTAQGGSIDPIDVPFAISNVETRGGMTHVIDPNRMVCFYYIPHTPDLYEIHYQANLITVGGTAHNVFRIRIPNGRVASHGTATAGHGADSAVWQVLRVISDANSPWIVVVKDNFTNFTVPAAQTYICFQITVRLLPITE